MPKRVPQTFCPSRLRRTSNFVFVKFVSDKLEERLEIFWPPMVKTRVEHFYLASSVE